MAQVGIVMGSDSDYADHGKGSRHLGTAGRQL